MVGEGSTVNLMDYHSRICLWFQANTPDESIRTSHRRMLNFLCIYEGACWKERNHNWIHRYIKCACVCMCAHRSIDIERSFDCALWYSLLDQAMARAPSAAEMLPKYNTDAVWIRLFAVRNATRAACSMQPWAVCMYALFVEEARMVIFDSTQIWDCIETLVRAPRSGGKGTVA